MARDDQDRYYTPRLFAAAFIEEAMLLMGGVPRCVVEPAAGDAPFALQGLRVGASAAVCDLDAEAGIFRDDHPLASVAQYADFRDMEYPEGPNTWLVTNPPFGDIYATIQELRRKQLRHGYELLAVLARNTALEKYRSKLGSPPHMVFVSPQRAKWGGPGGIQYGSPDSIGFHMGVWFLDANPHNQTHMVTMSDWRDIHGNPIPYDLAGTVSRSG
jgi:hypothetical protein